MRAIHAPVEPLLIGSAGRGLVSTATALSKIHQRLNTHHHNHHHYHQQHCRRLPPPTRPPPARRWMSSGSALAATARRLRHDNGVKALLAALRQNDTVRLYFCLMDLTRGVNLLDRDFSAAVSCIPVTTFSEIIHAFDPLTISRELDSASGLRISYGAAIHTPLGDLLNKWGVKVLYVQILNRLILMYRARKRESRLTNSALVRPTPNDYRILIRCAAATSDIVLAKSFYRQLTSMGYGNWIHSDLYTDFVKAWYLTESLYTRHDFAAVRLRPVDMHLDLPRRIIRRLQGIELKMLKTQYQGRFGQMVRKFYYAESARKILKLRKPLDGLMSKALPPDDLANVDEHLICAFIKAKGRHGGLDSIKHLLMQCWGITVRQQRKEDGTVVYSIGGGYTDIPRESCIAPTAALLDAIVHGYGNSGEAQLAGDLIQYISQLYGIPIPDQVWSDLLCYARIHRARPANREWLMARLPHKITHKDYVYQLWQTATQEPYNFNPRLEDYLELLKEQVGRDKAAVFRDWNLELIRQVKTLYGMLTQQLQNAWADLMHTTRQGVPNHAAYRRYRNLLSRKHYAWHTFQYITQRILKHVVPLEVDDPRAVRIIPDLILELEQFQRSRVEYRIATGFVSLKLGSTIKWRGMKWRDMRNEVQYLEEDDGSISGLQHTAQEEHYLHDDEDEPALGQALDEVALEKAADALAEKRAAPRPATEGDLEAAAEGDKADEISEESSPESSHEPSHDKPETIRVDIRRENPSFEREIARPAFGRRPKPIAPAGQISLASLQAEGVIFTGFADQPRFAAKMMVVVTKRARGVPADLNPKHLGRSQSLLEQLARMRR